MASLDESVYFSVKIVSLNKSTEEVRKIGRHKTIGEIVCQSEIIHEIFLSDSKGQSQSRTRVEHTTPVDVILKLNIGTHVTVYLQTKDKTDEIDTKKPKNAFDVLLGLYRKSDFLPEEREVVNAKDRLYNEVLALFKSSGVGFHKDRHELAKTCVCQLTNLLWFLDGHHQQLALRGCKIPDLFDKFQEFDDYKSKKKKKPVLHCSILEDHCSKLGSMLLMPWLQNPNHGYFQKCLSKLFDTLQKYVRNMKENLQRTVANHEKTEAVRSLKDNWSLRSLILGDKSNSHPLSAMMDNKDLYEVVSLDEFLPKNGAQVKQFIDNLIFPYPVSLMTYSFGNYLGNIYFLWKTKESGREEAEITAVHNVLDNLPMHSTRAMRNNFLEKYKDIAKPHMLRHMWRDLMQDESAPETEDESQIDIRVAEYFLSADDTDVIVDLRKHNGKVADERYNVFWDTLKTVLEEKAAVHERRKDEGMYMPDWISIRDLREDILQQCPEGTLAPSESWIRLNFMPANPYLNSAAHYTGRFTVKYAVQQRLLRAQHPDSKFCAVLWRYLKEFAIKWRLCAHLVAVDDKAIIPVGEPMCPVASINRRHNRSIATSPLLAMDHDYHIAGIVPSVVLHIIIPDNRNDSFHSGNLSVSIKDKLFEPSTPMRHSTELSKILLFGMDPDGGDFNEVVPGDFIVPVLLLYSDGGPDHNLTFLSVKLAAIALFMYLDLDMYIAVRCAPCQSYMNPAERCMSVLNVALQSVAMSRTEMPQHFETTMKRLSSLDSVRRAAERNEQLKNALEKSMEQPKEIVNKRFQRLIYSGNPVVAVPGADALSIANVADILKIFSDDPELDPETPVDIDLMKKKTEKFPKLLDFMEHHCRSRRYSFQIRKCRREECWYCGLLHPVRTQPDKFESMDWLPDPQKSGDEWQSFDEVYGTETTDMCRPSLHTNPTSSEDDENKALFIAARVRSFVVCAECGKRRCVFAIAQLTMQETLALKRHQDELIYTCGDSLFEGELHRRLVVRQAITCATPIEVVYYSGLHGEQPICFHCGDTDVLDRTHPGMADFYSSFGTVRPICQICWDSGLQPATRNAVKTARKNKK